MSSGLVVRQLLIGWSNQVVFEVISHEFLEEELDALGESVQTDESESEQVMLN